MSSIRLAERLCQKPGPGAIQCALEVDATASVGLPPGIPTPGRLPCCCRHLLGVHGRTLRQRVSHTPGQACTLVLQVRGVERRSSSWSAVWQQVNGCSTSPMRRQQFLIGLALEQPWILPPYKEQEQPSWSPLHEEIHTFVLNRSKSQAFVETQGRVEFLHMDADGFLCDSCFGQ